VHDPEATEPVTGTGNPAQKSTRAGCLPARVSEFELSRSARRFRAYRTPNRRFPCRISRRTCPRWRECQPDRRCAAKAGSTRTAQCRIDRS